MRADRKQISDDSDFKALANFVKPLAEKRARMSDPEWEEFVVSEIVGGNDLLRDFLELMSETGLKEADQAVRKADRELKLAKTDEDRTSSRVHQAEAIEARKLKRQQWQNLQKCFEKCRDQLIEKLSGLVDDRNHQH